MKIQVVFLLILVSCETEQVLFRDMFSPNQVEAPVVQEKFQIWKLSGKMRIPRFREVKKRAEVRYNGDKIQCEIREVTHTGYELLPVSFVKSLEELPVLTGIDRDTMLKWFPEGDDIILIFAEERIFPQGKNFVVEPIKRVTGFVEVTDRKCKHYFSNLSELTHFTKYVAEGVERIFKKEFLLTFNPVADSVEEGLEQGPLERQELVESGHN